MAKVEKIDVVKLELTSYELRLITEALDYMASEGQYSSIQEDKDARKLHGELSG